MNYQPTGHQTVVPYLVVENAAAILEFLERVFDATVTERIESGSGRTVHAELRIGDSTVMLGEATEGVPPSSAALYVYVPDTDATYRRAIDLGAASLMEPADQYYGDRNAGVYDPAGNRWWIGTHLRDVPREEMERLARERS